MKSKSLETDGTASSNFHLMAKPAGPRCNLHCAYCFYLEKKRFFEQESKIQMSDEILEAYTRNYIQTQPGPAVEFSWQGGEPTLLGIDFFQRALDLQQKYGTGKVISNTIQTNGTTINEDWCAFLAKNRFLVGLSLDGPARVHNAFRRDRAGKPTLNTVLNSLKMMQEHGVEVNVLAAINRESARHPHEVYRFFKQIGVRFIQFIPIVEREPDPKAQGLGLPLAAPPSLAKKEQATSVTPFSVEAEPFGEFLIRIFDEWVRNDVGRIFVMNFEWCLGAWLRAPAGVCYLSPRCGHNLIVEHDGEVFSCDHFMYPAFRLGNILSDGLSALVQSERQIAFGAVKETALPDYCRSCEYLFACRGGCPKHRFSQTPDGAPGLNHLCPGLKKFFHHVEPAMHHMANLVLGGHPVDQIMAAVDQLEASG